MKLYWNTYCNMEETKEAEEKEGWSVKLVAVRGRQPIWFFFGKQLTLSI
jgi:hypothetical protein